MMNWRNLVAFVMLGGAAPVSAHGLADARYLGNEGVLVTRGDTKILFDAFYAESFDGEYTLVPDAIETKMMEGKAPYDDVDAIFISHIHPDHFNSRKTLAYLRAHPSVRLYAGLDVVGALAAADASSDPIMKRVTIVYSPVGQGPRQFDVEGISVESFAIPHNGNGPIPHYAFRVTLDGSTTVMHLGDADAKAAHFTPYQKSFDQKATHAAFVPHWFFASEEGKRIIEQQIRPAKAIGIHVDKDVRGQSPDERKKLGDFFVEPGETRPIP